MSKLYQFKLFLTGSEQKAEKLEAHVRQVLDTVIRDQYTLELVDVTLAPEATEQYMILATPTLSRLKPEPMKRIVGNFENGKHILDALDLSA